MFTFIFSNIFSCWSRSGMKMTRRSSSCSLKIKSISFYQWRLHPSAVLASIRVGWWPPPVAPCSPCPPPPESGETFEQKNGFWVLFVCSWPWSSVLILQNNSSVVSRSFTSFPWNVLIFLERFHRTVSFVFCFSPTRRSDSIASPLMIHTDSQTSLKFDKFCTIKFIFMVTSINAIELLTPKRSRQNKNVSILFKLMDFVLFSGT